MRRFFSFLLLIFFSFSLESADLTLKEKFAEAQAGSFLVTEQNKIFTFLYVYARQGESIVFEEISIPYAKRNKIACSWKEWFERGAPGHSSWIVFQINVRTGHFEEAYSYTHKSFIDTQRADPFLVTLLSLRFNELEDAERRKVGIPPAYGKPDRRNLWQPRLISNGQIIENVPFTAWKARWPNDGSELSRKNIEIYLPAFSYYNYYPTYFPYWLEVEGKFGSAKIRVVDSGMHAVSPRMALPSRCSEWSLVPMDESSYLQKERAE